MRKELLKRLALARYFGVSTLARKVEFHFAEEPISCTKQTFI
jgi:hypothetical protein